jgi:branched-chain amino acid transport system substrate-binding protein
MKHVKTVFILVAAMVLALVLLAGCSQQQATPTQEIKIGVVASMTGSASTTGKDIWQSAVIAADEINAKGGVSVGGKKLPVRVILGDDESTREGGMKAVTKLITDDQVDLLTGGFSSAVTSAYEGIVSQYKVPFIVTGASRRTDIDTSTVFHHCPTTDDYGEQTTLFVDDTIRSAVYSKFGFPADRPLRMGIIYQDSPYGKGVLSAVNNTIRSKNLNMQIVAEQTFKMGESDFRTALTSVKAAGPDVVYPVAFLNEQIPLVTQGRRDVGLNTIYLAVECNDDPDYYKGVGSYGEYSIMESRFSPYTMPKGEPLTTQAFKDAYKAKWGGFPGMMGASTYEGVYIAARAFQDAGTLDKAAVTSAIQKVTVSQMVEAMQNGQITFTPDYRESKFKLYMEQLYMDPTANEPRPKIVWPSSLKETDFVLPDWYEPGNR